MLAIGQEYKSVAKRSSSGLRVCYVPWFPCNQEGLLGEDEGDEHVGVLLGVAQLRHEARRAPLPKIHRQGCNGLSNAEVKYPAVVAIRYGGKISKRWRCEVGVKVEGPQRSGLRKI
jgi:hypothetical protein